MRSLVQSGMEKLSLKFLLQQNPLYISTWKKLEKEKSSSAHSCGNTQIRSHFANNLCIYRKQHLKQLLLIGKQQDVLQKGTAKHCTLQSEKHSNMLKKQVPGNK